MSWAPFVLLVGLAPMAFADVLTVGLNGQYGTLFQAAAACSDGDVLLVMSGTYGSASFVDKGITIVADAGADVSIQGQLEIRDLGSGKAVLVHGLEILGTAAEDSAFKLESNSGSVFIENCDIRGFGSGFVASGKGRPAAEVLFCGAVSFVGCTLNGGSGGLCAEGACNPGAGGAGQGGNGLFIRASKVALESCSISGGKGGTYDFAENYDGLSAGHALEIRNGQVHIADSDLLGGNGGLKDCGLTGCGQDGLGGHAVLMGTVTAAVTLREATLTGGAGSTTGSAIENPLSGLVVTYPSAVRRLVGSAPLRVGETLVLTFQGEVNDLVSLWFAFQPGWISMSTRQGVFQLGFPLALPGGLGLGALPASGSLVVPLIVPPLSGLEGFPVFFQGLFVDPDDGALLGSPTSTVLLDAAF